jgi:flagellar biogenesis protein FliO
MGFLIKQTQLFQWSRVLMSFGVVLALIGFLALVVEWLKNSRLIRKCTFQRSKPIHLVFGMMVDSKRRIVIIRDADYEYTLLLGTHRDLLLQKRTLDTLLRKSE